ncbi:hypothetical protein [uncultured Tateyamaria sp.]|uniref:hypothetical protein n=1 Tax=uncultured Tateyamaria sp. TaxID=455651 RepID=UPI002609C12C|nr:hypothetical protein [uncultured Tateyamaria sp.]
MLDKLTQQDLALIVAKLSAKYGSQLNQVELAKRLETSQPSISRALTTAKTQNILVETFRFNGVMSAAADAVVARFERDVPALLTRLQALEMDQTDVALHEIEVIDPEILAPDAGRKMQLDHFATGVGSILTQWLSGADRVGVTWGGGVYHGLAKVDYSALAGAPPVFAPSCGNIRTGRGQFTSTAIAGNANEWAGNDHAELGANALGVNAFVPIEYSFDPAERTKFAEIMLESSTAYQRLLGGYLDRPESHAAGQYGTLITGCGMDGQCYGSNSHDFQKIITPRGPDMEQQQAESLRKIETWFVGEFAGNLLLADVELTDAEREEAAQIQSLWTGLRVNDIREIAKRANGRNRKGVIAIGTGDDRARTLLQAIRLGLVSKIVLDRALFDALERLAHAAD